MNPIDIFFPLLTSFATLYPLIFPLTLNFSQNNTRHLYITQKAVCLTDRIYFYKRERKPKNRKSQDTIFVILKVTSCSKESKKFTFYPYKRVRLNFG